MLGSGIVIVGIVLTACGGEANRTSSPHPTPTVGTLHLPTPTPLSTVPAIGLNSPILGGAWQAFDDLYGNSNCCSQNGWNYQGQFGPSWTGTVEASDSASVLPADPNSRVTGIQLDPQAAQPNWSASEAQAMLDQFMPPDARQESRKAIYVGTTVVGAEEIYISLLLANTLPLSDFKGIDGSQEKPGTFFVYVNDGGQTGYDVSTLGTNESYVLTAI
jgi:hypothetical protein